MITSSSIAPLGRFSSTCHKIFDFIRVYPQHGQLVCIGTIIIFPSSILLVFSSLSLLFLQQNKKACMNFSQLKLLKSRNSFSFFFYPGFFFCKDTWMDFAQPDESFGPAMTSSLRYFQNKTSVITEFHIKFCSTWCAIFPFSSGCGSGGSGGPPSAPGWLH